MPSHAYPKHDCNYQGPISMPRRHYTAHCDDTILQASGVRHPYSIGDCGFIYSRLSTSYARNHFGMKHKDLDVDACLLPKANDRDEQGRMFSDCLAEIVPTQLLQVPQPQEIAPGPQIISSSLSFPPEVTDNRALLESSYDSFDYRNIPQLQCDASWGADTVLSQP